jgi:hypothetical protein
MSSWPVSVENAIVRKIGLAILLAAVAGVASATPAGFTCTTEYFLGIFPYQVCTTPDHQKHVVAAPEVDAASAATGLTLLMGGLAVLRGRRSKKT